MLSFLFFLLCEDTMTMQSHVTGCNKIKQEGKYQFLLSIQINE